MPFRSATFLISCLVFTIPLGASVELDPGNRWQVRQFYNAVYPADPEVVPEWTGDLATGQPGTVSEEWQAETRQRIDFFRTLAGIPGQIAFDPDRSRMAQQAALMMSAAGQLSHAPGPDWPWYSEAGALGAARSNLALGTSGPNGPDAVDGYMIDPGGSNFGVGHRRWLLYPHPVPMGNGDVPADENGEYRAANALWVIPGEASQRLPTRDPFVSWPPRGFVPAQLVYSRWSFSHPGADFSAAAVTMQSAGESIPLSLEPLDARRIGDPTLVWVPEGMPTDTRYHWPLPPEDEPVTVTVENVLIDGVPESFTYTVTIFDPATRGPGEFASRPVLDGELLPGQAASFTVEAPPWSEAVQARIIGTAPGVPTFGAEAAEPELIADTHASYSPVQESRVASGNEAYKLAHPAARSESLTLPGEYLVGSDSAVLTFDSSLAWATGNQTARVEINTCSGESWVPLWSHSGPVEDNNSFTPVSVDLGQWSGKTARFRFHYYFDGGQYYPQTDPGIGWAIDRIRLEGVEAVARIEELPAQEATTRFSLIPASPDPLHLQTRSHAFGGFPLPWGPVIRFDPAPTGGLQTRLDEWIFDPVVGWNYADSVTGTRSVNMGWVDHSAFPWIWTGAGWIYYQQGSLADGLWIYHPEWGQAFTHESYGPWFTHQPWEASSWKSFIP